MNNNLYKFHSYSDKFTTSSTSINSNNIEVKTCIELSMTFMQIMPQHFEIPDFLSTQNKDCYFLMFGIGLQFLKTSLGLELDKFRFSIMGTDSNHNEKGGYNTYPLEYSFKQFIKDNYCLFTNNKLEFSFDKEKYTISPNDQETIKDGLQYLDLIFPNDKNIVIIDEHNADFYKGDGLQDGISLYEQSTTLQKMLILNQKFPEKQHSSITKKSKI